MTKRFRRGRWRRPQRLTLEGPTVVRRKDLVVPALLPIEREEAWRENRRRMAMLLGAFVVASAAWGALVGWAAGAAWLGLPVGTALALGYLVAGARFGDGWLRAGLRASRSEDPQAQNLIEGLSRTAGMPRPELFVCPGEAPNAIALGLRRRWIALSAGTAGLGRLELEALLAHELVHLRNGDAALGSGFVLIAGAPELLVKGFRATGGPLTVLAAPLVPVCLLLRSARRALFPADREHRADVGGALLTRYPPGVRRLLIGSNVEHGSAGVGITDPFWFAPRTGDPDPGISGRAERIDEM